MVAVRIGTLRTGAGTSAALIGADTAQPLAFPDAGAWLAAGGPEPGTAASGPPVPLAEADFAPVIPRPSKIVCVGLNYREHIKEMGRELPEYPTLFAKFTEALLGPTDDIVLPPESTSVDWEGELAVVIGARVRRADETAARTAIAGFTVSNDISARDFQRRTPQWLQGKTFDSTTPLGPWLATLDEVGPEPALQLTCRIDGQLKQEANTRDLVFGPVQLIRYISAITTLNPGDVILTGTPGGVGDGRTPREYLNPGTLVETTIDSLGSTANRCVAAPGVPGGDFPQKD